MALPQHPHPPGSHRWRHWDGQWQVLLALAALAVVAFSVSSYWHARADLRAYRVQAARSCYFGGAPPCLLWEHVSVESVTRGTSDTAAELNVSWPDGEPVPIYFVGDPPLLHRVSKGSLVWVGIPSSYGYIMAVSDDSHDPPPNGLLVTQTAASPVYGVLAPLVWLVAGACAALFFGWRAVLVRVRRPGPPGQTALRTLGGGAVVAAIVGAVQYSTAPSTFDIRMLVFYGTAFGVAVVLQGLLLVVTRWRRRHAARGQPPSGQATNAGPVQARSQGSRRPTQPATPVQLTKPPPQLTVQHTKRSRAGIPPSSRRPAARSLPPAGGLGVMHMRRLLRSVPAWPGPVGGVAAPPVLETQAAATAVHLGLSPPDRVLLGAEPVVELHVARSPDHLAELSIGAVLALALPRRDLRALVAHAIAVQREPHPSLASALLSARKSLAAMQQANQVPMFDTSTTAFLADTEAFCTDIEERADEAASRAASTAGQALAALIRAAVVARDFQLFCAHFLPTADNPTFPATLYSGWLSTLSQRMPRWWLDPAYQPDDIAGDVAAHPGLATEWGKRPHAPVWSRPRTHGLLTSLSTSDQSRLAREYLAGAAGMDATQPTPLAWSAFDADRIHRDSFGSPTPTASIMLGHQASPEEILSMVEADGGQWLVAAVRNQAHGSLDGRRYAVTAGTVLAGLASEVLHWAGYRHADVLRPQLMSNPAGHRVDLYAVVTDALASAEGMDRLRALLLAGSTT